MKYLKVTVSGWIDETRIGTESEMTKWLSDLKKRQEIGIGSDLVKQVQSARKRAKYHEEVDIDPRQHQFPLKIKIEPYISENGYY